MRVLADPQLLERISLLSDRPDLQVKISDLSASYIPPCRKLIFLPFLRFYFQPFAAAALNRRTPVQGGARSSAGLFSNINSSILEGPQSHWQVLQRPLYEMLRTIFNQ